MGHRRKCQTYTASPAEPGGLPVMLEGQVGHHDAENQKDSEIERPGPVHVALPMTQRGLPMRSISLAVGCFKRTPLSSRVSP
jgi:hypothetical protein